MSRQVDSERLSLVEGEDYYWEGAAMVFTARFHLKRGYCCQSGCRHCPYGFKKKQDENITRDKR
ncbi:MAG: hypothetical protein H0V88_05750 [Pyrinomonadaceae bacterium]|nr:hypothetical protein [Pyrinomonadaceae bacterium]